MVEILSSQLSNYQIIKKKKKRSRCSKQGRGSIAYGGYSVKGSIIEPACLSINTIFFFDTI